jgi:hypothetical protein
MAHHIGRNYAYLKEINFQNQLYRVRTANPPLLSNFPDLKGQPLRNNLTSVISAGR